MIENNPNIRFANYVNELVSCKNYNGFTKRIRKDKMNRDSYKSKYTK